MPFPNLAAEGGIPLNKKKIMISIPKIVMGVESFHRFAPPLHPFSMFFKTEHSSDKNQKTGKILAVSLIPGGREAPK